MTEDLIGFPDDPGGGFPSVYWASWDVDAAFLPGDVLPEESRGLLWAVLAIVYYGDKVVLADIEGRGLCIPSGKIEPGETVDQALEREVHEETGARLDPQRRQLIGCYRLESRKARPASERQPDAPAPVGAERQPDAPAPVRSSGPPRLRYCPVFIAEARGFEPIPPGSESRGIFLASIEDLADLYYTWDDLMAAVFDHAERLRGTLLPSGIPLSDLIDSES